MEIKRVNKENFRFSQAVQYGRYLFISGQYGDCNKDMREQSRELFAKCDEILAQFGIDKRRVLFVNIGICDIHNNISSFNEAWDEWIVKGEEPARTCLGVETAFEGYLAEVSFIAAL